MAPSGASSGEEVSRRWPELFGRAPRLASAYWQRKTTSGEVDGLGWAAGGAGPGKWAPGKSR